MTAKTFLQEFEKGRYDFTGATVDGDLNLSGRHIDKLEIQDLRVKGEFDLSDSSINSSLYFTNSQIDGDLVLSGARINGPLQLLGSVKGEIDLSFFSYLNLIT